MIKQIFFMWKFQRTFYSNSQLIVILSSFLSRSPDGKSQLFYIFLCYPALYICIQNVLFQQDFLQQFMETIKKLANRSAQLMFQRIFLMQQHSFESRILTVMVFVLEFITGINAVIFCDMKISSNQTLQNYLKIGLGRQILNEQILIIISILLMLIVLTYLILCQKISLKEKENGAPKKFPNQDFITTILISLTYVINGLFIWILNSIIQNFVYIFSKNTMDFKSMLLGLFGVVQFIFFITFSYAYEVLFVSLSFQSANIMLKYSTINHFYIQLWNVFVLTIVATGLFQIKMIQIICQVLVFASVAYKIYQEIFFVRFFNQFAKKISNALSTCNFMLSFILTVQAIISMQLIEKNMLTIFIILTFFCLLAINSYQNHRKIAVSMLQIQELQNFADIRRYLEILLRFKCDNSSQIQLIMMSLIQVHRIKCMELNCYCKDRKNQLKVSIKNFSLQKWKLIMRQFYKNVKVSLMSQYFLYQCFEYFPQIIIFLENLAQRQKSLQCNYLAYHLRMRIFSDTKKKNYEKNLAETEGPINLDTILDNVLAKMSKCATSFYQKYRYLTKGLCRVSQIEQGNQLQLKIMKQIEEFYQGNKDKYKKSVQFSIVLYFFFSKVFILNVRINQIRRNLLTLKCSYQMSFMNDTQNNSFKKSIYGNSCCSFESCLSNKNLGIITNASKNTKKLFELDKEAIIGKNIKIIMPSFMHQEHQKLLKEWYKTGSQNNLGVVKYSFCIDQRLNIFQVKVYLKLYVNITNLLGFVAMVKKEDNKDDLIVINEHNIIEGYGSRIAQLIGVEAKKIPAQLILSDFELLDLIEENEKELTIEIRRLKDTEYQKNIQRFNELKTKLNLSRKYLGRDEINGIFQGEIMHYLCKFVVKKHQIGNLQNISLKLLTVLENGFIRNSGSFRQNFQSMLEGSNIFQTKSANQNQKAKIEQIAGESVNSSQTNDNYFIVKVMKTYFQFFIKCQSIHSKKISITTYILFILIALIVVQLISVHFLYLIGLNSVYEVCFADGAVSDNMQLFQFLYGNSMLMKQFKNDTIELKVIHNSSKDMEDYVYSLLAYDMEYLFKSIVTLTKLPYYQYMRLPIEWKFSQESLQIESYQFLEYYYYLTRQSRKTQPTQQYLNLFMKNFPQMKRINHYNLQFYADQVMKVIFWLNFIFYTNIGLLLIISIAAGYTLHHFYYQKYRTNIKCCELYLLLSHQQLEQLRNYYEKVQHYLLSAIQENNLGTNAQQHMISVIKGSKNAKLNIINNKKYVSFCWIIIFIIILNALNMVSNLQTQKLFGPSNDMVITMSQLMDSENYLIESYFEMKAYFFIGNQSKTVNQMVDQLLKRVQYDELLFNKIATRSLKLFTKYDSTYQEDFVNLLVDNICGIVQNNITDFQKWQCNLDMHENLIDMGVIGGMNQFYRQVQSSLNMLKNIDISKFDANPYFKTKTVRETDRNIIYMFKMYQTTQQRIMLSLETLIIADFNSRFLWLSGEIALVSMLLFYWVFHIRSEKKSIGNMYGSFLLVPQAVVSEYKSIIKSTEEIINYDQT